MSRRYLASASSFSRTVMRFTSDSWAAVFLPLGRERSMNSSSIWASDPRSSLSLSTPTSSWISTLTCSVAMLSCWSSRATFYDMFDPLNCLSMLPKFFITEWAPLPTHATLLLSPCRCESMLAAHGFTGRTRLR